MGDLICISHLRWDFVWQRPQHLLSRLARHYRILFVETVTSTEEKFPRLVTSDAYKAPNVTVARLIQPVAQNHWIGHGNPLTQPTYETLLRAYLQAEHYNAPILWLYTPMASDFVQTIDHRLLVVDVMDQLSAFKGAPAELIKREEELLQNADLVFTGGASLHRSKRLHNPDTHMFPSGVEIEHFARAATPGAFERPADIAGLVGPILGYFGVIDERMDLLLLAHLAQSQPDWNIVMLGPIVKIDPAELPQAQNIHYLGMRQYDELPAYLAHFDVALIPFAMNEATRYLSPTKTLEYMAAHKLIVSNPIHDVIELYGDVVRVAYTPDEFVQHVKEALVRGDDPERRAKEDMLLAKYTWNNVAARMINLINTHLSRQQVSDGQSVPVSPA